MKNEWITNSSGITSSQKTSTAKTPCRRGAVSLEFAIVLPIYALVIMSTITIGIRMFQIEQYASMCKYLGRQAIVHGKDADRLGPWGPISMAGSFGDGSDIGELMANKFNDGDPIDIYYRLNWPDGGNDGRGGDRVEVIIASAPIPASSDPLASSSAGTGSGNSSGLLSVTTRVLMRIVH